MSSRKLTDMQQLFVREYLVDLNATQAALRAGYSDGSYGRQLITKPHVEQAIQRQMGRRSERVEVTADRVLQELARIGFAQTGHAFEWDVDSVAFVPSRDLTPDQMAAVAGVKAETTHHTFENGTRETKIKLELKMHDKLGALREIGKHLGIAERFEHSGPDGGPIEIQELSDDELVKRAQELTNRIGALTAADGPSSNGKH